MNWYSRAFPCPHRLILVAGQNPKMLPVFFWDAFLLALGAKVQKWNISRCTFFSNFTFRFWSDTNVMFSLNIFITGVTRTQPSKDYCIIIAKYWNAEKRLSKNITLSKYLHSCNKYVRILKQMQKSIYNLYFQNTPKKGRRKSKQKVPIWRDSDNEEVWLVCTFVTCSSNNFAFDFWSSNVLHNSIKVMSFIQTHLVIIKKNV